MNTVVKFQKRAASSILDKPIETPSVELFSELKWMMFPDRIIYQKALLMYKIMHNLAPSYLSNIFTLSSEVHERSLRSTTENLLYVPNQKLSSTETVLLIQDLKYGTPFQNISEIQHLSNNLERIILNGLYMYLRHRTLIVYKDVYICYM